VCNVLLVYFRVLCCAVLCCAVLCCAVLCCVVLCCVVLCCVVLCCVELCYSVLPPAQDENQFVVKSNNNNQIVISITWG
jgi:hypothetical protein